LFPSFFDLVFIFRKVEAIFACATFITESTNCKAFAVHLQALCLCTLAGGLGMSGGFMLDDIQAHGGNT
jgi:hypothetical protein